MIRKGFLATLVIILLIGAIIFISLFGISFFASKPKIESISPDSGSVGTIVSLDGSGFTYSGNKLNFGSGVIAGLVSGDGNTLVFTLPPEINPACYYSEPRCPLEPIKIQPGEYNVSVSNAGGTSNTVIFTVK